MASRQVSLMGTIGPIMLVDEGGRRLNSRIERVLGMLVPRLRRHFPELTDPAILSGVLEKAGRRLIRREKRIGPIERLPGYAWVTLRSVATSEMRRGAARLVLNSESSDSSLSSIRATDGTAEDIERAVLLRELLSMLSPPDRLLCVWKQAGFSSEEIAAFQGRSSAAVDTQLSRIRLKLRQRLARLR